MSLRLVLSAVLAAGLAACTSGTGPTGPARGIDPFDGTTLSRYTPYADAELASWEIAGGELVAEGVGDQSVLIRHDISFGDGWVEAIASRADDSGLVLRFNHDSLYYLLAFRDDDAPAPRGERNLAIYRRDRQGYQQLLERDITWARGQRRTIRFMAKADTLSVWMDGELLGAARDYFPLGAIPPGDVGVRHYGAGPSWVTRLESFAWHEGLD